MSDQKPDVSTEKKTQFGDIDSLLRKLREYVAAGLAAAVVLTALVMIVLSFGLIDPKSPDRFAHAKDLLQMVVPLVTFILGYYFNKASTEARAENAEAVAQSASQTAQQATNERDKAVEEAKAASDETAQVKDALQEMGEAAQALIASVPEKAPGTMRDEGLAVDMEATRSARRDLITAWERAQRVLRH